MIAIDAAEYLTAFQLRRALCRALLEHAQQQRAFIDAEQYDQLLDLLKSKQDLLDHLGRLAREQLPLRSAWRDDRDQIPAGDRARCDAVLNETESLLAKLIAEEQSCSQRMTARRDVTARSLQSLSVGVQAQHAYHPADDPVLSRFDLNT